MNARPNPGEIAPAFQATAVGGSYLEPSLVRLADFSGQTVALVFYPKDDTPGCTRQACALRDGWQELSGRAVIFGVSGDSLESHRKFISKHSLPYPLLSDPDHAIAIAYGVWVEKSMYGRKSMGIERTTFVIGPDGRIRTVLPKVKPDDHWDSLKACL